MQTSQCDKADAVFTDKGRRIAPGACELPEAKLTTVNALTFLDEIGGFIDGHLSGLVAFSKDVSVSRFAYIDIDPHCTALFFKELILAVRGRTLIHAHLLTDDDHVGVCIDPATERLLTEGERTRLQAVATLAGFDIKFSDGIVIKTKHRRKSFALIYAIGSRKISKIFENVIFDLQN